mmetsp:Transcript_54762/g.113172  ORF Transcript_54762/g.113172 Transcript_54762/m.113172 type:complete len:215 (+) Transcript_54762:232-876(+)
MPATWSSWAIIWTGINALLSRPPDWMRIQKRWQPSRRKSRYNVSWRTTTLCHYCMQQKHPRRLCWLCPLLLEAISMRPWDPGACCPRSRPPGCVGNFWKAFVIFTRICTYCTAMSSRATSSWFQQGQGWSFSWVTSALHVSARERHPSSATSLDYKALMATWHQRSCLSRIMADRWTFLPLASSYLRSLLDMSHSIPPPMCAPRWSLIHRRGSL